jgi:hypothetical protein
MIVEPGYQPLADTLIEALNQAQYGKGKKCHANGLPFLEQEIIKEGISVGLGGHVFQIRKKVREAMNCDDVDRAVEDVLGAIVYAAAMVLLLKGKPESEERSHSTRLPPENVERRIYTIWGRPVSVTGEELPAQESEGINHNRSEWISHNRSECINHNRSECAHPNYSEVPAREAKLSEEELQALFGTSLRNACGEEYTMVEPSNKQAPHTDL